MADGEDLAAALQLADEKAQAAFPERIEECETVFREVDAMRRALLMIHHNVDSPRTVDEGYKKLHDAFYAFHEIPKKSKAMFAFKSEPANWIGFKRSSVIHCIWESALKHLEILQHGSRYVTLCPSDEMRELYPECWFDADHCKLLTEKLRMSVPVEEIKWPSNSRADKQTAEQTIEQTISAEKQTEVGQNCSKEKKPWTSLAADLKARWFAEMTKRKRWIPRSEFFVEFLNGKEGQRNKWKGVKATTEDRRFQDNQGQWKDESERLKTSLKNRR